MSAPIFALDGSSQIVVTGALTGMAYAVLAVGLVLVFRATRVINFAHGQIGAFCGSVLAKLVLDFDWPFGVAFVVAVGLGGAIGAAVELLVIRRLFRAPRLVLLVATIGVSQVLLFAELRLISIEENSLYPTPISSTVELGDVLLIGPHFMLIGFVPAIVLALTVFLNRTPWGIAIRAAAANGDTARLAGINVRRVSTLVWILAGVLAAVTAILLNPVRGTVPGAVDVALGPALLLRALTAALVGRMSSLPWTLAGGVGVGVIEAVVFASYGPEMVELVLFAAVLASILLLGPTASTDEGTYSLSERVRPLPIRLQPVWWIRHLGFLVGGLGIAAFSLVPFVFSDASELFLWSRMLVFAIIGLSLTVLTGWAGQLSLGQFGFVGVGAFVTGALVERGVPFAISVIWSMVAGTLVALAVGTPALRIRGLFLSVTTLAFAVAAGTWAFNQEVLSGTRAVSSLPRPELAGIDFASQRSYYYLCLAILVATLLVTTQLRRSGIGRILIAVRDNEPAAAAYSVSPTQAKLIAFAVSGAIAALAGGLLAGLLPGFSADDFGTGESLRVASMAIIGGVGSAAGAVLGALWVIGLPALFSDVSGIAVITSGAGLLVLVLYLPGGLTSLLYRGRDLLLDRVDRQRPATVETPSTPTQQVRVEAVARSAGRLDELVGVGTSLPPALAVEAVTVRFGGRLALDGVSLEVSEGETVGLIGSNGAGKSTLMNAISGFVPHEGEVWIRGVSIGHLSPADRARLGLGRGFQDARLFSDLTVREVLQVALERSEASELVPSMLALPPARLAERAKRARADELVDFLGLGDFADRFISELSTGTRRVVELAGLLALGCEMLLLDEPTAGVAQREVEAFGPLIGRMKAELGATVLLIEHDIPLVASMSDRVYCLEAGRVIAEGEPDQIRQDPRVIASYLGTDERAVQRSGNPVEAVT